MSRLPGKKRDVSAKTPLVSARAVHESILRKPVDKSDNTSLAKGSGKLKGRKKRIARTLKLSSPLQKQISPKSAGIRRQKGQSTEDVQSKPETQTKATVPASRKLSLSSEARALLAKVDEGGIPFIITRNLERIANEHGIEVNDSMTPNELINRLRDFL